MRALAIASCIAVLMVLAAPAARASSSRPAWLPKIAWAVGECETGLDPHHSTTGYVSAWGFARSVWQWFRRPDGASDPDQHTYPADATRASLWQQWRVTARKVRHFHGWSGWGCYDNGGYLVWMARA